MNIGEVIPWILNNKIWVVLGIMLLFLAYNQFFKRKKPYCFVRIKELRGKTLIDHPKEYPAYLRSIIDESGSKIEWMFISGIKKNWKPVKGDELIPTINGSRLVELVWFGGNSFQRVGISQFAYEKLENQKVYRRKRIDRYTMQVLPDENQYLEHEVTHTINKLSQTESAWLTWLKQAGIFLGVLAICAILFYKTMTYAGNEILGRLDETNKNIDGLGNRFINMVNTYQQNQVDENTKKGGVQVDSGGGG